MMIGEETIAVVALAFSLLIAALLAAIVFVSNRRDRIRLDAYAEAFGDVPALPRREDRP